MNRTYLTSFALLFSSIHAQDYSLANNLVQRLKTAEKTLSTLSNPPALPAPGLFIEGDVLFWQARETGLGYAIIASQPPTPMALPEEMDIKEPEFEWDFGSKIALGFGTKSDGWDFLARWTRFLTDAHDNGIISSNDFFLPIWSDPNFNIFPLSQITDVEPHWHLHFNAVDVELGKGFYATKYLVLRPFIGPSCVWINQHYNIEYSEVPFVSIFPVRKDHIHLKNDYFGIGARAGCELRFHLTRALSLFANGSGAIYSGSFEIQRKEKFDSLLGTKSFKTKDTLRAGRSAAALDIGFHWEHAIDKNRRYVRAELSYGIQFYFKQNQMLRVNGKVLNPSFTFLTDQGDLSLHGGSFSFTVGF